MSKNMKEITENEMHFILAILKTPEQELNARSISKLIGITHMGTSKIAKRLEKECIISSKTIGKAIIYKLNLSKDYVKQYIKFLLQREAEHSNAYLKRWVEELKKLKKAEAIILFGSVIKKGEQANDIDAIIVVRKNNFKSLRKEIEEINIVNTKKIHPIFQTKEDLRENIKSEDKVVLNAIKGIVVSGEENILEALQ